MHAHLNFSAPLEGGQSAMILISYWDTPVQRLRRNRFINGTTYCSVVKLELQNKLLAVGTSLKSEEDCPTFFTGARYALMRALKKTTLSRRDRVLIYSEFYRQFPGKAALQTFEMELL